MSGLRLDGLRRAMEGVMASVLATCDANGIPNVSMISQVHYVDPERVALSYQFFNKTRRNVMETRRATVLVTDPETLGHFRLALAYEGTETAGPLFESMKAKLAGIASHHGVEDVFRLLGSDVYRVLSVEAVPGPVVPLVTNRPSLLAATRRTFAALDACADLDELLDCTTACLDRDFGIGCSMVLMAGGEAGRLYAVASRGYPVTGVGAEVAPGEGVIGVAARENAPIRIGHMTREYRYGEALARVVDSIGRAPSGTSFGLVALRSNARPSPRDAAFSREGRVFVTLYGIWADPAGDDANLAWLRASVDGCRSFATGSYVGESDLDRPGTPIPTLSAEAAGRLAALRQLHDPMGSFGDSAGRGSCSAA